MYILANICMCVSFAYGRDKFFFLLVFKFLSLILVRKEPKKLKFSSQSYKFALGGALCNSKGKKDKREAKISAVRVNLVKRE